MSDPERMLTEIDSLKRQLQDTIVMRDAHNRSQAAFIKVLSEQLDAARALNAELYEALQTLFVDFAEFEGCYCGQVIGGSKRDGAPTGACGHCLAEKALAKASGGDICEWIIQRCTQEWIGTELQYQDWGPHGPGAMIPVSKTEMIDVLKAIEKRWPDDEFRGHNIGACKCHSGVTA